VQGGGISGSALGGEGVGKESAMKPGREGRAAFNAAVLRARQCEEDGAIYIYIAWYIFIYTHKHIYIYIYIYIQREREAGAGGVRGVQRGRSPRAPVRGGRCCLLECYIFRIEGYLAHKKLLPPRTLP